MRTLVQFGHALMFAGALSLTACGGSALATDVNAKVQAVFAQLGNTLIPDLQSALAVDLAKTAIEASAPVVAAVPSAIASVAATPAAKRPCDSANTRMRMAPEQGRTPAAITVPAALRQEKAPSRRLGSGAWTWPHSSR